MKPIKRLLALIALAGAGVGCATTVNSETLEVPVKKTSVTLRAPFSYVGQYGGSCKPRIEYSLASGEYVAERQDADGIFYLGPANGVTSKLLSVSCNGGNMGRGLQMNGGIYVPNNPAQDAKGYFYEPSNALYDVFLTGVTSPPRAGLIIDTIIEANHGKIQFLPLQPSDGTLRGSVIFSVDAN